MKIALQFAMPSEFHALPGARDLEPAETVSGVPIFEAAPGILACAGGVSKVNIATDLELAMLAVVGREGHMTEAELNACTPEQIEKSREAVRELVELKITDYLLSRDKA